MGSMRDVRRCTLQVLYQFDAGNAESELIRASLDQSPGTSECHDQPGRRTMRRTRWLPHSLLTGRPIASRSSTGASCAWPTTK